MTAPLVAASAGSALIGAFSALRDRLFTKTDTNKNGSVSLDEFLSSGKNLPSGSSASAKSDKAKAFFAKVDTDSDGTLSKTEVDAYTQSLVGKFQGSLLDVQEQLGQNGSLASRLASVPKLGDQFSAIDTDTSGGLSKTELTDFLKAKRPNATDVEAKAEKLFAKMDVDGDGSITKAEIAAYDSKRIEAFAQQIVKKAGKIQPSLLAQALKAYNSTASNTGSQLV